MKIVIPIAGRGSRFQAVAGTVTEYAKPKPLIEIMGKPMVMWALESLPFIDLPHRASQGNIKVTASDIIFVVLAEHQKQYHIADKLKQIVGSSVNVELIPEVTRGALETALCAKKYLNNEEMILSDCDHYFDGTPLYDAITNKDSDTEGILPVFKPADTEPKWSYTLFDKRNVAQAVGEKDPALAARGAYANIGAYYFRNCNVFVREAEEMIAENDMHGPAGKQEFYVAPVYQRMINKGMKITAAVTPKVWGLGTPNDVALFMDTFK